MSFSSIAKTPVKCVFASVGLNGLPPNYHVVLDHLRYYGLYFTWQMRNAFEFDSQIAVQRYVVRLKYILVRQFSLLVKSRQLSHEEQHICQLVGHHIWQLVWPSSVRIYLVIHQVVLVMFISKYYITIYERERVVTQIEQVVHWEPRDHEFNP